MWGFYLSCCPECTEGRSVNNPWFRSLLLWLRDKFSLVRLKVGLLISCHISMTSVLYLSIDQDFWKIVPVLNKHRQFFFKIPLPILWNNHQYNICVLWGMMHNLKMCYCRWEDVPGLYSNAALFYIRDWNLWILYLGQSLNKFPTDIKGRLSNMYKTVPISDALYIKSVQWELIYVER